MMAIIKVSSLSSFGQIQSSDILVHSITRVLGDFRFQSHVFSIRSLILRLIRICVGCYSAKMLSTIIRVADIIEPDKIQRYIAADLAL